MKLPVIDPHFTETPDVGSREVFHSFSKGICPICRALVDGVRILRGGKVFLRKQCPTDGQSEALISGDADWFRYQPACREGPCSIQARRQWRTING